MADIMINPLADMMTRLLATLAEKQLLTKEEAINCIAQSAKLFADLPYSSGAIENGSEMLMRMIKAIDTGVEPSRPIT
ncbi:hypothetical protein [Sphingomonas sp. NFX23]|uniref:hypothetical protein n=1 Tax=Sphingomonas sp. NFX23 TaxID=2819532 RepID=UPI003CEBBA60